MLQSSRRRFAQLCFHNLDNEKAAIKRKEDLHRHTCHDSPIDLLLRVEPLSCLLIALLVLKKKPDYVKP